MISLRCASLPAVLASSLFAQTLPQLPTSSPAVEAIRKAGTLTCGVDQSEAEFSMTDEHGSRVAFDRDLCNAVAAAILGQGYRVELKGYPDEDTALQALRGGEVDMVASVSDDLTHSTLPGIALARPVLYDWQGFLVPRSAGIARASQLSGHKICVLGETEAEVNLRSWFQRRHLNFVPFPFQEEGEMEAAFVTANCTALFGDVTRLANTRAAFGTHAHEFVLLPDVVAQDPLASAYRNNDAAFAHIVQWSFEVLLLAEQQHVTAKGMATLHAGYSPETDRLLDSAHALGRPLGLADGWPVRVIQAVGNYGELFRRDVGAGSPLNLPRLPPTPGNGGDPLQPLPFK
jgi:general L-amino acid transport system substrate-binding protein